MYVIFIKEDVCSGEDVLKLTHTYTHQYAPTHTCKQNGIVHLYAYKYPCRYIYTESGVHIQPQFTLSHSTHINQFDLTTKNIDNQKKSPLFESDKGQMSLVPRHSNLGMSAYILNKTYCRSS